MITNIPSSFANAVAPFNPLGRQPVGQENTDPKPTTFKPLEEPAESARKESRRPEEERLADVDERNRVSGQREQKEGGQQASDTQDQRDEIARKQERLQREQLEQEQDRIRELAARDREVRAHERAHVAVGGEHAGAAQYQYTRGPDGVSYAVSGEVPISTGAIPGNPEATIAKAQQVKRAALAPADPSPQDRRVAAEASRMEMAARVEVQQLQREEEAREAEMRAAQEEEKRAEKNLRENSRAEREAQTRENRDELVQEAAEATNRNLDINRRLIEIGVVEPPVPAGTILNHIV